MFRFFTSAEWAALPAASKRQRELTREIAGREITRTVKFYVDEKGKETVAIVTDSPPIVEQRG